MKIARASDSDVISNLPDSIIEKILTFLPIRDAARTSVLSSEWRYKWVKLPHLIFDDLVCGTPLRNQLSACILDRVLLVHRGPIFKFTLSISGPNCSSEIDQGIIFLLKNGVHSLQQFTLHIWGYERYKLPLSLYPCSELTHLDLRWCVFTPPTTFSGFSRLISLVLCEVLITADVLASFISGCPLLENLSVETCAIVDFLEIVAPNLKSFCFKAILQSVRLVNAPILTRVSIRLHATIPMAEGPDDMIKIFGPVPVVENLHLDNYYVKCLAARDFKATFVHLEVLNLSRICFDRSEVSSALSLIGNSPNLRKIIINAQFKGDSARGPVQEFYERARGTSFSFKKIQEVEIVYLSGTVLEMEFLKFLLAKSPLLEELIITLNTWRVVDQGLMILKELTQFRRSSPYAEIKLIDPSENWWNDLF